jgi:DNA repair protein RecN (Recombination protein N)
VLAELRVEQLGVIDELRIVLAPGLTVLTGETGAGKTLVVEALELLLGGRADPSMVRAGADEAVVEGRFVVRRQGGDGDGQSPRRDGADGGTRRDDVDAGDGGGHTTRRRGGDGAERGAWREGGDDDVEIVLARAVPRSGRGRSYLDGRMAPLGALADAGADLVDLHGQHSHQSLLRPVAQRAALDRFAGVDLTGVRELRRRVGALDERLGELGGDDRERARELDVLAFQLEEIAAAKLDDPDEEEHLAAEEVVLAGAAALRAAAEAARRAIGDGEPNALDLVADALEELDPHPPLTEMSVRLRAVVAELGDAASELRRAAEGFEEDPERLAAVQERRQLLRSLRRKYGDTLTEVIAFAAEATRRSEELRSTDVRRAELAKERAGLLDELAVAEQAVGDLRRAAAGRLGAAVQARLRSLAMDRARIEVVVPASGIGDEVELLLAANEGEPPLPLAKVASGGELARAMLALRLVLTAGPPTLVFDEVDAGIGGMAALAVGTALAELTSDHQVLVVTHLAQVAAQADQHLAVVKEFEGGRTRAVVRAVEGEARVAELSRMLSGHPDSPAARQHAEELLGMRSAGPVPVGRGREVAARHAADRGLLTEVRELLPDTTDEI